MPDLSPEWLTQTLRAAGTLPRGHVITIQQQKNAAFNSHLQHLSLTYSQDAPSDAPLHLVYKANLPQEWAKEAGKAEVGFYRQIAERPNHPQMIVPCYAAEYDPATGNSYLLLRDLSHTHHAPLTRDQVLTPGQNVPSDGDADAVVETLALFHAYWWEHALLGSPTFPITRWFRSEAGFHEYTERRTLAFHGLKSAEASWLPAEVLSIYQSVLDAMPSLWERYWVPRIASMHALALTHGDAYFSNFLCPKHGSGDVYLLDWQSPETLYAASDLANLMATFWTSEQRRENEREERLLRRYHARLQAAGVSNYTWEELKRDYRLAIIDWLLVPLQDHRDGCKQDYWWWKMQCLLGAYKDWRCEEL